MNLKEICKSLGKVLLFCVAFDREHFLVKNN